MVNKDDSLPADPISVSLAIQAGKAIAVPEAKLAYGFVQNPIDGLPKVYISSVKEENLYALKNDVIVLKKATPHPKPKKPEEDYPDIDDEENAESDCDEVQPRLTYKQLGYVAEQYKDPPFAKVEPPLVGVPSVVSGKVTVDCGFKPGRIATMGRYKPRAPSTSCR